MVSFGEVLAGAVLANAVTALVATLVFRSKDNDVLWRKLGVLAAGLFVAYAGALAGLQLGWL